jgi:small-conductance mechanosensitive channel
VDEQTSWWNTLTGLFSGDEVITRVVLILLGGIIAILIFRLSIRRVVAGVVSGVKKAHGVDDTQALETSPVEAMRQVQRTRTLGSVLNNFAGWTIGIIVILMVLSEAGLSITPLIASAGIIGAALGFGAQSLVKDMLNGMFMVFEDQLGVGDVVNVGEVSGVVERLGVRVTEIRDVNGTLWFVRNGEINRVGNYSQDWARVILDIPVPYYSDVSKVQERLLDTARAFRMRPEWKRKVLEDPEVWGIESISAEALVVRLVLKVRGGEQWAAKRALHADIITTLDKEGIDLPPLNRMVLDGIQGVRGASKPMTPKTPHNEQLSDDLDGE